jgi:hypothetical protein
MSGTMGLGRAEHGAGWQGKVAGYYDLENKVAQNGDGADWR